MKKQLGRPHKVSTNEKIAIVERYYIENSTGGEKLLGSHGVYRRLSEYAKSLGSPLEWYDFSRDSEVRKHIKSIVEMCAQGTTNYSTVLTYEPLDVIALMMSGREHILQTIKDRENYYLELHKKAARAIEQYSLVAKQATQYKEELERLREQKADIETQLDLAIEELRSAKKDIAYLKRIVRKEVEPKCAQQFLSGLTSREQAVNAAETFVIKSINSLVAEDKQLQAEAQEEVDMMDLNSLFA